MTKRIGLTAALLLLAGCGTTPAGLAPTPAPSPSMEAVSPLAPQVAQPAAGGRVAVIDGRTVVLVDAATGERRPLADAPAWDGNQPPNVSRDGKFAVWGTETLRGKRLVLWDVEQGAAVALPEALAADARQADVSDGGKRLVFLTGPTWEPQLGVYDPGTDAGFAMAIPAVKTSVVQRPTVSGDGRIAAVVVDPPFDDSEIALVDLVERGPIATPLLNTRDVETDPALGRDGRIVLFASDRGGSMDLYAFDRVAGRYLDVDRFNSFGEEARPRFVGAGDEGIAWLTGVGAGARLVVKEDAGW